MKMKLLKQILHSAIKNKKGVLFLFEVLFIGVLLTCFVIGYQTVNLSFDYTKVVTHTKAFDLFTIIVAKGITDSSEIRDLIDWYLPNTEYYIYNYNSEPISTLQNKKNCIAKTISIWNGFPVNKKTIFVKICF